MVYFKLVIIIGVFALCHRWILGCGLNKLCLKVYKENNHWHKKSNEFQHRPDLVPILTSPVNLQVFPLDICWLSSLAYFHWYAKKLELLVLPDGTVVKVLGRLEIFQAPFMELLLVESYVSNHRPLELLHILFNISIHSLLAPVNSFVVSFL